MPGPGATQALMAIRGAKSTLQNTNNVYADLDDASKDLPNAFHEVAKVIPLVERTLGTIETYIQSRSRKTKEETREDQDAYQQIAKLAKQCDERAARLQTIFGKVIPPDGTPVQERYRSAAGKGGRVELLMKGILEDVIALAKEPFVGPDEAECLRAALKEIMELEPSLPENTGSHVFNNHGSGPQSIHLGTGDQNINTGPAPQFNGQFMAPFHLGGFGFSNLEM
ncbi:hypothetical protein N656DRAFT_785128 [Canariomyces notabilis]|uniref:NACHT-NTPase and P-loop NTPases N-terminal domain-containing protein n=1 Tax=Canariomyces notabilis TaxID=2074819 RepID=A0AAN6QG71_9PEZI|nr:hypothetical protein N656DRAFT_785128 [Canariomyces arenarius]